MQTISSIFKAAAKASAAGLSPAEHLNKLQTFIGEGDFYRALEKSLSHSDAISEHIAAADAPMATALEVNEMTERSRNGLRLEVALGL
ncbi:hypothetical protein [Pseudomonas sp. B21-048]|uniref:hypothetical protein n=1 Tax=Pseudomonas sp. B21-048 TaxID=2895490 RepID=UPI00215F2269|nr:hypothetical protein [Pseudomonas sp. B21-048]UVK96459.1 hypothetical protein LOY56_13600 [Pseudomonas sp. B21-048]